MVLTTTTLRLAVTDWCNDPTAAEATHGHISTWDTSGAEDMSYLFSRYDSNWNDGGAYCSTSDTFNEDLFWDTSQVTTMKFMFYEASSFNGDLSSFDTSQVTTMALMFYEASSFNGDLSSFDTSQVTTMDRMFYYASSFDGDLSSFDTSQVTTMEYMFEQALALIATSNFLPSWREPRRH